ncbi:MAG: hypothetical protein LCH91_13870 [Bacteroidetes bacterium]|nr:hypothetical protein [Bacteroidota bacterium]
MDITQILTNIDKLTKEGIPLNVGVEQKTLATTGGYLIAGFAIAGLLAGGVMALAYTYSKKAR